ncbi:hypothetical protein L226DRAFT_526089 [Lentinus tigrinus ALCF2SS1-7]|uniref:uncharacterized protein n=1 Tax=Lentinus tigrinus ALCF2SS1-7 TaxID=1328758 RepID=UPI0011660434|nr:hypothetical protein L226DRAFT_526089 [Lentinus tigrinus ALCF2SS1-7]
MDWLKFTRAVQDAKISAETFRDVFDEGFSEIIGSSPAGELRPGNAYRPLCAVGLFTSLAADFHAFKVFVVDSIWQQLRIGGGPGAPAVPVAQEHLCRDGVSNIQGAGEVNAAQPTGDHGVQAGSSRPSRSRPSTLPAASTLPVPSVLPAATPKRAEAALPLTPPSTHQKQTRVRAVPVQGTTPAAAARSTTPVGSPSLGKVFADVDVLIKRQTKVRTNGDQIVITAWFQTQGDERIVAPPASASLEDPAIGDIFMHVTPTHPPQFFLHVHGVDGRVGWWPIDTGYRRADGLRLSRTPKLQEPSWVKDAQYMSNLRKIAAMSRA